MSVFQVHPIGILLTVDEYGLTQLQIITVHTKYSCSPNLADIYYRYEANLNISLNIIRFLRMIKI